MRRVITILFCVFILYLLPTSAYTEPRRSFGGYLAVGYGLLNLENKPKNSYNPIESVDARLVTISGGISFFHGHTIVAIEALLPTKDKYLSEEGQRETIMGQTVTAHKYESVYGGMLRWHQHLFYNIYGSLGGGLIGREYKFKYTGGAYPVREESGGNIDYLAWSYGLGIRYKSLFLEGQILKIANRDMDDLEEDYESDWKVRTISLGFLF